MSIDEQYIQRCLELAKQGFGNVAPNPMVGCVIVYQNIIIGEGYHHQYGEAHAEVNAIKSVKDSSLLSQSTLYVSLEPCAHYGKTPPCSNLIIEHKIKRVVIGCIDSFSLVAGKGITQLKEAGINVTINVLEKECRALNKRFFTFHEQKRPYIILKWAQSQDRFIAKHDTNYNAIKTAISSHQTNQLVHKWRTEEQAILVGYKTALIDNPQLTSRSIEGKNPIRIIIDMQLELPPHLHIFDNAVQTIIVNIHKEAQENNVHYLKVDANTWVSDLLNNLYTKNIQSIIIEGGSKTLQKFIEQNLWDEARIIESNTILKNGIKAPILTNYNFSQTTPLNQSDKLILLTNHNF